MSYFFTKSCSFLTENVKLLKQLLLPFRTLVSDGQTSQEYVRNIGIIAHVDAGKTTTTERMLYYAGCTPQLGNVDRGDTVMDFLEEERDRGITINAAAISFCWRKSERRKESDTLPFSISLVDTPGHVDFAVEVERSLFVVDGAVVILDASAGVEAQTLSVTQRARSYKLPMIAFLNKLDKPSANVTMCLRSIQKQLLAVPLLLQLPLFGETKGKQLVGVIDLINMTAVRYDLENDASGKSFNRLNIPENLEQEARESRRHLVETAAQLDDCFAESFLAIEDALSPDLNSKLANAVASICQDSRALPVLVGSSLRNIGVQFLLDAITNNLPSPVSKKNDITKLFGSDLNLASGLIFKTITDKFKGQLAYCRLYSGTLRRGSHVFLNNNFDTKTEKVLRVYSIMADELKEIEEAEWGGIVAISGLKQAKTGSLITSRKLDQNEMAALSNALPLKCLHIPPPVFSCTIEAESSSLQSALESALQIITKEDPSLAMSSTEDGSQLIISGLGELHLDIVKRRLQKEFKLQTLFGPLQIAYIEAITKPARRFISENVVIEGRTYSVAFDIEIKPSKRQQETNSGSSFHFDCPDVQVVKSGKESQIEFVKHSEMKALNFGLESACRSGPLLRCPVQPSFDCRLYAFAISPGTSMAIVAATFSKAIKRLLQDASPILLEPYMQVEVQVESPFLSAILSDLARRQAIIEDTAKEDNSVDSRVLIRCTAPLRTLRGYATDARMLASGRISLAMELAKYQPVTNPRDFEAIKTECGYGIANIRSG